jgi:diguanylate cyclase (GGDEF)-like protein
LASGQARARIASGGGDPTPALPPPGGVRGAVFLDAAPALVLGGATLVGGFGQMTLCAGWALISAAGVKLAVLGLDSRPGGGTRDGGAARARVPAALQGLAAVALAAAFGFVCLAVWLAAAPASVRTAAAISAVGYVALSGEREASRPLVAGLQAVCALGLLALGVVLAWDRFAPVALAATFCLGVALVMAFRWRSRGVGRTREAETRFAMALDSMAHCVGMFDAQGRLVAGNGQFRRMFRLAVGDAGETAENLLRDKLAPDCKDPASIDALCAAAQGGVGGRKRRCVMVELADGRWFEFTFQPTEGGFSLAVEDVTARRASEMRIERMARIDDLTGLSNRTGFREQLARATAGIADGAPPFAVMMIDLDRFKQVNDSLGHPVGDKLLQRVAKRLQDIAEAGDAVARLGGDEFVVLYFGGRAGAATFAARVVETLSEPYHVDGAKLMIGASVGLAMAPGDGGDANELLKAADMALYAAKDAGRGAYRFFAASMAEEARRKQEIEQDLRIGIGRNELEVHYQPIVSLARRRICGCEALVRWRHPSHGLMSPAQFIGIAEDSGLIVALGEWVLRRACLDARGWPRDVRLAVNFSAVQFARSNVADTVRRVLKDTRFPASRLEMEITESALAHDFEGVVATIDELRDMGMRVSLDDFGSGVSSLARLGRFRPNKVKIDHCFARDMAGDGVSLAIIKAVKAIVMELDIDMLVEGVETMQQFEILIANGADEAQGYLFSKPRPAREIARFVADPAQLVRGRKLIIEKSAPWAAVCERVDPAAARRAG